MDPRVSSPSPGVGSNNPDSYDTGPKRQKDGPLPSAVEPQEDSADDNDEDDM